MVRSQFPAELVLCNRQPMPGLQVLFEHLALISAFDADDVVRSNRAPHRHCRNTRRFFYDLITKTVQCRMHSIDQTGDLVGCNRVVPHVSRHDVGRVALVFDNHGGEFLLRLAGIAIVKHVRRYEGGRFEVNLARYSKMFRAVI